MSRRPTFSEMIWPDDPDDADMPVVWAQSVAVQVLDWMWRGFDAVRQKYLSSMNLNSFTPEQLERNLTEFHFLEVSLLWARETGGYGSLQPCHESPELEKRVNALAKPPAYDLGFVHIENRRWKWPIEAKILTTSARLADYLKDVHCKFITGIAGPFVGEGGMIGYLLQGKAGEVFDNLVIKLGQPLLPVPDFQKRNHLSSQHERRGAPTLCLHHMIMELVSSLTCN